MQNKNVLLLLPDDEHQYLNFIYETWGEYFKNIYRFNFVKYFCQNGIKNTEKYIEKLMVDKKIDIILFFFYATNHELSVEFIASLKNKVKIVFWQGDDESYFDVYYKYYCQIANAVITSDYFSIFAYKRLSIPTILYLPTSNHKIYYPVETVKNIDVCFVGSCLQSDRLKYINFLVKNGINIETFGYGSKNGFVDSGELALILSRSKIVLNFNRLSKLDWINEDEPLLNRVRQMGGHCVESALTKTFCLAEYTPDLHNILEIGKETDIFYDENDLLKKIKYYLIHDDEREKMAKNAYEKAINNYIPEITIPKMLNELERILEENEQSKIKMNGIFLSRNFKVKSINGLTFSMFMLIKNRKIKYALEVFKKLFKYGVRIFLLGFCGGTARALKNILNKTSKYYEKI